VKVLAPGFYARQDIKTPVKIALVTLILTQLMNLAFIWQFKHAGLALAIGLGACFNATLLLVMLLRKKLFVPQPGWRSFLLRLLIAVVVMSTALMVAMHFFPSFEHGHMWSRALRLTALVMIGVSAYFITLGLLGFRPRHFMHRTAN
jgi:putative peptidoglycan lipid II flippase